MTRTIACPWAYTLIFNMATGDTDEYFNTLPAVDNLITAIFLLKHYDAKGKNYTNQASSVSVPRHRAAMRKRIEWRRGRWPIDAHLLVPSFGDLTVLPQKVGGTPLGRLDWRAALRATPAQRERREAVERRGHSLRRDGVA